MYLGGSAGFQTHKPLLHSGFDHSSLAKTRVQCQAKELPMPPCPMFSPLQAASVESQVFRELLASMHQNQGSSVI